jgi:hypothetical protein
MSFARVLACIALMGGAAGCGSVMDLADLPPPATGDEVQFAHDTYVSCLVTQASRLDDGKGTPIALALKVIPFCEMQFAYFQEITSRGDEAVSRYTVRDSLKANNEAFVASIVRRVRLARAFGP